MSDLKKVARVVREETPEPDLQTGTWWWVKINKREEPYLCCLVHLGSNYAEFESAGETHYTDVRVLYTEFHLYCTPETNAEHFIKQQIETRRQKVGYLLEEVKDVTARLALDAAPGGGETEALTISTGAQPVEEYKLALITAKNETLPNLFKQIEAANKAMGAWMRADLLPLEASVQSLKPQIKKIENRIFNVELYAGLIETIVQIREGDPAPAEEPLHLYQRRAYMDEECLANYKHGGMDFNNIEAFDRWFVQPENLERILPHPRG